MKVLIEREAEKRKAMSESRYIAIEISQEFLTELLTTGHRFDSCVHVVDGLPNGAKFVRAEYIYYPPTAVFIYEHESFPQVKDGDKIPRKAIMLKRDTN